MCVRDIDFASFYDLNFGTIMFHMYHYMSYKTFNELITISHVQQQFTKLANLKCFCMMWTKPHFAQFEDLCKNYEYYAILMNV
jgi:hypothetical protein